MPPNYTPEFKKKIVRLRKEEGRTIKSITAEYGVSKASISKWCSDFSKECKNNPTLQAEYDNMKEMLKLKKENEELKKEILFLMIVVYKEVKKQSKNLVKKARQGDTSTLLFSFALTCLHECLRGN